MSDRSGTFAIAMSFVDVQCLGFPLSTKHVSGFVAFVAERGCVGSLFSL